MQSSVPTQSFCIGSTLSIMLWLFVFTDFFPVIQDFFKDKNLVLIILYFDMLRIILFSKYLTSKSFCKNPSKFFVLESFLGIFCYLFPLLFVFINQMLGSSSQEVTWNGNPERIEVDYYYLPFYSYLFKINFYCSKKGNKLLCFLVNS